MQVGFIGLGAMGRGMAGTLLSTGHEITGFDLNPAALDWLEQSGGTRAVSAAQACDGAEAASSVSFENTTTRSPGAMRSALSAVASRADRSRTSANVKRRSPSERARRSPQPRSRAPSRSLPARFSVEDAIYL